VDEEVVIVVVERALFLGMMTRVLTLINRNDLRQMSSMRPVSHSQLLNLLRGLWLALLRAPDMTSSWRLTGSGSGYPWQGPESRYWNGDTDFRRGNWRKEYRIGDYIDEEEEDIEGLLLEESHTSSWTVS
jgi:hypothetical protein